MAEDVYQAKAAYVKVSVGSPGGSRVARIIARGGIIPAGVDAEKLKALAKRGLIEKVKAQPKAQRQSQDSGSGSRQAPEGQPHANAGEDKWREYAQKLGIEVPADADKAKIRELVDEHNQAQA